MNEKYTPINPEDVFPKIDPSLITNILKDKTESVQPKIETIDYLLNSLAIEKELIKNDDIAIRNYIFTTITARKHLYEIEERIKNINARINQFNNKECYPCRKLVYFKKKNEKAKNEIIEFLCYGLNKYLSEHNESYSDLIERDDSDKMWLLGPTYDYNYNYQYYNPDYDFSTYVKFFNTPKVSILDSFKNINNSIALKEEDAEKYYQKVINTVDSNNLLENMADRIGLNYHFHKRKEIFESMAALFKEENYTTFVLTAAIQIEGMFFELVTIRYGERDNQGTLSEKADKTFSKNSQQKHALYPYFAFDVPDLRNKVAHIGIVDDNNIKNIAYELVLDLNCIFTLAEQESINKFQNIVYIISKIEDVISSNDFKTEEDKRKAIAKQLFFELLSSDLTADKYFWQLIANPSAYEDELNYYLPKKINKKDIYLKDMVNYIHRILLHEIFWQVVLDVCDDFSEINYNKIHDIGVFVKKLKNMLIPILNGKAKEICINVNKELHGKTVID